MAEYASKGVAGTGLGLGIAGTALGVLAGNNGGNGLLGGLFGGGPNLQGIIAAKDAKIAKLSAEKYSDNQNAVLYAATRAENQKLRDDIFAYVRPLADEAAANKTAVAVMQTEIAKNKEIAELREQLVRKDIDCLRGAVAAQGATLAGITKIVVPKDAICPEYMNRYNAWVAPTNAAPGAGG